MFTNPSAPRQSAVIATDPHEPFDSLEDLQAHHAALAAAVGKDLLVRGAAKKVEEFVYRAIKTGANLDIKEQRLAAQGLINYWAARLASTSREAEAEGRNVILPEFDDSLLAEFAEQAHHQAAQAAEQAITPLIKRDPRFEDAIRCVLLRLMRLPAEGTTFLPVKASQAELEENCDPELLQEVVPVLEKAGVITRGTSESSSPVHYTLKHAALSRHWPRLAGWLEKRAMFRDAAAFWLKHNRDAGALFSKALVDQSRIYKDRNALEEEFFAACEKEVERQEEANTWAVRTWRATAGGIAVLLMAVSITGWSAWSAARAEIDLQKELSDAKGKREEAERLREQAEDEQKRATEEQERAVKNRETAARTSLLWFLLQALGDIASAESKEERDYARTQWNALTTMARHDLVGYLQDYHAIIQEVLDGMPDTKNKAAQTTSFKRAQRQVLALANQIRDQLVNSGDQMAVAQLEALRVVAFSRAGLVADMIFTAAEKRRSFDTVRSYARDFWKLYWGVMGLVEGAEVEAAMVQLGGFLSRWEEADPNEPAPIGILGELKDACAKLAEALDHERQSSLGQAAHQNSRY